MANRSCARADVDERRLIINRRVEKQLQYLYALSEIVIGLDIVTIDRLLGSNRNLVTVTTYQGTKCCPARPDCLGAGRDAQEPLRHEPFFDAAGRIDIDQLLLFVDKSHGFPGGL